MKLSNKNLSLLLGHGDFQVSLINKPLFRHIPLNYVIEYLNLLVITQLSLSFYSNLTKINSAHTTDKKQIGEDEWQ